MNFLSRGEAANWIKLRIIYLPFPPSVEEKFENEWANVVSFCDPKRFVELEKSKTPEMLISYVRRNYESKKMVFLDKIDDLFEFVCKLVIKLERMRRIFGSVRLWPCEKGCETATTDHTTNSHERGDLLLLPILHCCVIPRLALCCPSQAFAVLFLSLTSLQLKNEQNEDLIHEIECAGVCPILNVTRRGEGREERRKRMTAYSVWWYIRRLSSSSSSWNLKLSWIHEFWFLNHTHTHTLTHTQRTL